MAKDTIRCAICAAEFASSADLVQHEVQWHTQHGGSGVNPGSEDPSGEEAESPRKNRTFTRRNVE